VVRVFDDPDVTHVDGRVDPSEDIATINTELVLADLQTIDNRLARLEREARMKPERRAELAAVQAARDLADKGVPAGSLTIDWPSLMRFKRSLVDPTTQRTEQAWAKMGIEQFHGRARFVGATTLAVGADQLTGRHVVIAAGAVPAPLSFPGADRLITSEQFLNLDALPPRMVFVGGGYIAFEFAHVAARAGVEVTIVHRGARPLDAFDPDLVDLLVRRTREVGIRVELGTEVRGVETLADRIIVLGARDGQERRFETDMAVHAAGRVPDLDDLDLDRHEDSSRAAPSAGP